MLGVQETFLAWVPSFSPSDDFWSAERFAARRVSGAQRLQAFVEERFRAATADPQCVVWDGLRDGL